MNKGKRNCGEWLAEPIINPIYSNKMWVVTGVSQQIKEGSFQTLFDCHLMTPGVEINSDRDIGCNGSGGKKLNG